MPFIGKQPKVGAYQLIDSITTSATATYALTVDGSAYFPETARNLIVSLNGVTQAPDSAYTVSGSNIVFDSALTTSDVIDYILVIGDAVDIGVPSDGTVGNAQLASNIDLSGKTLTFANDQISGDAIDGGTATLDGLTVDASTLVVDSTNNRVGIGDDDPVARLQVSAGSTANAPTIGSISANAPFYLTNSDHAYGLVIGTNAGDGHTWLQGQRTDGTATAYNITLNEAGGNVSVGTTSAVTDSLSIAADYTFSWADSANSAYANIFREKSSAATVVASGYKYSGTSNKMDSAVAASWGKTAVWTGYESIRFYADAASADAVGTDLTPTERMRVDHHGGLRVGLTTNIFNSANHERMSVKHTGQGNAATFEATNISGGFPILYVRSTDSTSGSQNAIIFHRTNTQVGSITTTGSSTAYNTSSDYRLKENVTPLTEAVARVRQIPVHRFNFIEDPNVTVDGFLAHEVQGHVPEAVSGEKDGMKTEEYEITPAVLDDMGRTLEDAVMGTREVPDYQGIDQSKLVPLLTKAIQEQQAMIETLQAEVTALKEAP